MEVEKSPIEVEIVFMNLEVEETPIKVEFFWATSCGCTNGKKWFSFSLVTWIFLVSAPIEVAPFSIEVDKEFVVGGIIFDSVGLG